jgi:predicted phage terminase large subunit-like protein
VNTATAIQAARELLKRRAARSDIIAFAQTVDVPGRAVEDDEDDDKPLVNPKLALHHKLVCNAMQKCSATVGGRLMIFMPPGSAKSTYGSVVFPAHYLGANPKHRVGVFSYADTLAAKMGRRTRSIIKQKRYRSIFDTELSTESASVNNFTLTNGSEYMATGILGGVTGNRMEGIIIDDPIKGREQAQSETIREKTWDAYEDDIKTRLVPGGWLVIIQTRWHEDDLSGRILPEAWAGESGDFECKDGNVWTVICIQAECQVDDDPLGRKRGEMFWPEWFTLQHWAQFKTNARTWSALFQQLPVPRDGDMFKPDMMEILDVMPVGQIVWVRGWDFAASENDGDWTVGLKLGRFLTGVYANSFIIADVKRGQLGPDNRDRLLLNTTKADGRGIIQDLPQDPGQAGKSQVLGWVKMLLGYRVVSSVESGDKETRAEGPAAHVNVGNVYMLRGDWNESLREELRGFPNAKWKDRVDALSRAFARLLEITGKMQISKNLLQRVIRKV